MADLMLLRAMILERTSDEALYEVRILDQILDVLHRRAIGAKKPVEWCTVTYARFLAYPDKPKEFTWR